jgi:hypothetical protein
MVVDLETWITAAEIALVGEFTGRFSQDIYNSGKNWIIARFKDHPKEAQESANRNVNNFFGEVNIRVGALEKLYEDIGDKEEHALSDPDYTYLLYEAVLVAARTDSKQKHKLLARLVADRLQAETYSLQSLAVHTATNAILQLSAKHLKFLGVLSVIHDLQPASHPKGVDFKDLSQWYSKWLSDELSPMIPIGAMTEYDFMHLVAISCITYIPPQYPTTTFETMTFASKIPEEPDEWKLNAILEKKFHSFTGCNVLGSSLLLSNIEQELTKYWKDGLIKRASLTSAGSLIGMYVRDTISQ